ncbi:ribosomal protein L4 domain-containing protein [Collybia nuda]|uniref:Large ribosomal subunit protein uL4m n=1 Tax=Collybia nuda TaxID=64659 RepID=A0A9P5Y4P6_9AGAR|nr:ribosomal protein L4 domain-containing protein [Collybia nuda]
MQTATLKRGAGSVFYSSRRHSSNPLPSPVAKVSYVSGNELSTSHFQTAKPILEPLYLSLTQPFKRGKVDPPTAGNVVVLDPTVFNHPIRRDVLHLCVTHHLDSLRQGSANTKTRGEVRGSGIKIRRQKGSGRARLGDAQSPMLVGGGVAFGPKPRDFSTKLPRKVIEMGMRVALSVKMKEQRLGVMTSLNWPNGKTKHLAQRIDNLGLRKTLFVSGEEMLPIGLQRAIENIPMVKLITPDKLTVYEALKWQRIVLDVKAVDFLERTLKKTVPISLIPLSNGA